MNKPTHIPEMIEVKGGTFLMGATPEQLDEAEADETPLHEVTLSSFQIGKYTLTQELWESVMGNNPAKNRGAKRPVEQVSWYDAIIFCNALSEKEGLAKCYKKKDGLLNKLFGNLMDCDFSLNGYRLPTEAEWEYAARGGNKSQMYKYSGSNDVNEVGWYGAADNIGNRMIEEGTSEVGKKLPNELGIYDMSGNIWEWCWDLYNTYEPANQTDPSGEVVGANRVIRGGSWSGKTDYCRVSNRSNSSLEYGNSYLGFRLARTTK
jgi:formylglycine-generating enzyme required for sulfatase activity